MEKVVVYCHGYNSSKSADKVRMLRDAGFEVIACDIPKDPELGVKTLLDFVDDFLIENYSRDDLELIFVGTSLGGWYASTVAKYYDARSICINPAYDPTKLLNKLDKTCEVAHKFKPAVFDKNDIVVIAEDDEVIDFAGVDFSTADKLIKVSTGGHRFIGKEFDMIFDMIKEMK